MLSHPQETPWTALTWGCPFPAVHAVASHVSIVIVVAVVVLLL